MKLSTEELKKIIDMIKYINKNLNKVDEINDYLSKVNFEELSKLLEYLNFEYYNNSKNLLSDYLYDYIYSYYEKKIKNKQSKLNRIYSIDELNKKLIKFNNNLIITPKLDGLSVTLQKLPFKDFKLILKSKTETNDYTKILNEIDIDLSKIDKFINENNLYSFIASGELIIPKDKINKFPGRCEVNGLIKRKIYEKDSLKKIQIIFYSLYVLDKDDNLLIPDQYNELKYLKKLSLNIPKYIKLDKKDINILELKKFFDKIPYEIDGLVIKELIKNPKQLAYKFSSEKYNVIVQDIEWILKANKYTPIIIIDEITICNVKIKRLTAHNANKLISQKIGIGSIIEIEYTGMTIPTIKSVIKESEEYNFPIGYRWDNKEKKKHIIHSKIYSINTLQIEKFIKLYNVKNLHISSKKIDIILDYCDKEKILFDYKEENIIIWINLIKKIIKSKDKFFGEITDKEILKFCKNYKNIELDFLSLLSWIPVKNESNISYETMLSYNLKIKLNSLIDYNEEKITKILEKNKITKIKIDIILYKIKIFNLYYRKNLNIIYDNFR